MKTFLRSLLVILGCAMFLHASSCFDTDFSTGVFGACTPAESAPDADTEEDTDLSSPHEDLLCNLHRSALESVIPVREVLPPMPELSGPLSGNVLLPERPPRA